MNAMTASQRSRTYAGLAQAFSKAEPGLEAEYARLFLGPGRRVAHPHESVYREGRTMGESTLAVRRCLVEEGLGPNGQRLPDHVGIELAFMAHLAAREALAWDAGDRDEAWHRLREQQSFLREHLCVWLPQFCHRILTGRPLNHYAELARRTEAYVTGDLALVGAWLGDGSERERSSVPREGWGATAGRGCTLCFICVKVCRPGALRGTRDEGAWVASLSFDPTRCDGCAACQLWCPEGVISISKAEDGRLPGEGDLACSELLACPRCGRPNAPAAMVARIAEQIGAKQEALSQRLLICYDCKGLDMSRLRFAKAIERRAVVQQED